VARYLSDEWLAEVERALRHAGGRDGDRRDEDPGSELVVAHRVTGGPGGDRSYHVAVGRSGARVAPGAPDGRHVTFTQDYETAAAIARGTLSAQAAFMAGRLRVGGDLSVLVEHHRALADLDDVLAGVRATTTY
jgi:hypothetical protein